MTQASAEGCGCTDTSRSKVRSGLRLGLRQECLALSSAFQGLQQMRRVGPVLGVARLLDAATGEILPWLSTRSRIAAAALSFIWARRVGAQRLYSADGLALPWSRQSGSLFGKLFKDLEQDRALARREHLEQFSLDTRQHGQVLFQQLTPACAQLNRIRSNITSVSFPQDKAPVLQPAHHVRHCRPVDTGLLAEPRLTHPFARFNSREHNELAGGQSDITQGGYKAILGHLRRSVKGADQ